jgi:alkylhydroperoxidase family enzyme
LPRIPYFDLAEAPQEFRDAVAGMPPLNLFRMLPYAGRVAPAFVRMGGMILNRTILDPKLRELAILRVGVLTGSDYEVHHHRRVGKEVGLTREQMDAVASGPDSTVFDAGQRVVLAVTDAVIGQVKAPDALFAEALEALGPEALAELVMTIGYYRMVAGFLLNFGVEVEAESFSQSIIVER